MAMSTIYTCDKCGFEVDAWDDGNPYVQDSKGKRHYFYHPENGIDIMGKLLEPIPLPTSNSKESEESEPVFETHTGNAPDHLCLKCGKISLIDPEMDKMICKKCKSDEVTELTSLAGKKCPKCSGHFDQGREGGIS
jgi:DNA-directed RNA polymerase subunit RPC12/RpoP